MELKALSRLGWSVTALAHEYGLSRTTVYKELASSGPRSSGRAKPTELNDTQSIHIERRLSVFDATNIDLPRPVDPSAPPTGFFLLPIATAPARGSAEAA